MLATPPSSSSSDDLMTNHHTEHLSLLTPSSSSSSYKKNDGLPSFTTPSTSSSSSSWSTPLLHLKPSPMELDERCWPLVSNTTPHPSSSSSSSQTTQTQTHTSGGSGGQGPSSSSFPWIAPAALESHGPSSSIFTSSHSTLASSITHSTTTLLGNASSSSSSSSSSSPLPCSDWTAAMFVAHVLQEKSGISMRDFFHELRHFGLTHHTWFIPLPLLNTYETTAQSQSSLDTFLDRTTLLSLFPQLSSSSTSSPPTQSEKDTWTSMTPGLSPSSSSNLPFNTATVSPTPAPPPVSVPTTTPKTTLSTSNLPVPSSTTTTSSSSSSTLSYVEKLHQKKHKIKSLKEKLRYLHDQHEMDHQRLLDLESQFHQLQLEHQATQVMSKGWKLKSTKLSQEKKQWEREQQAYEALVLENNRLRPSSGHHETKALSNPLPEGSSMSSVGLDSRSLPPPSTPTVSSSSSSVLKHIDPTSFLFFPETSPSSSSLPPRLPHHRHQTTQTDDPGLPPIVSVDPHEVRGPDPEGVPSEKVGQSLRGWGFSKGRPHGPRGRVVWSVFTGLLLMIVWWIDVQGVWMKDSDGFTPRSTATSTPSSSSSSAPQALVYTMKYPLTFTGHWRFLNYFFQRWEEEAPVLFG
ncbi:hypothetical protein HMI54_001227 [Coelomomyces lativittatus]|nr:hypothetical protein HMI55_007065 [Coelomomyces lativittatus]KAJ1510977.1 hypothetical protein HMI54_001227 [Coelomomyces lativittatus]